MNTPTPETENVQAVPTLRGLRHYLDYQYTATRGDVLLNKICNQIAELERELNEAKKYELAYHTFLKAYGSSPSDFASSALIERDQLRKVADDYSTAWNLYKVFPSFVNERLFANAEEAYNQLPHVIERNKAK